MNTEAEIQHGESSIDSLVESPQSSVVALAVCALICTVSACMGAIWAGGGLYEMFTTLSRPVWCIPYEALLPVWSALHVAAAIALWRHWALRVQDNGRATLWFLLQYLFGVLWPFIYFEQQRPVAALSCAAIWWATSIGWLVAGRRISRFSALLLAPYTMWPLYLMALNFAIIRLNAHELAR